MSDDHATVTTEACFQTLSWVDERLQDPALDAAERAALNDFRIELTQRIVTLNRFVARMVALRLARGKWWFHDARSAGILALYDVIPRYRPDRGCSFASFAYRVLCQRVWDDVCRPGGARDARFRLADDDAPVDVRAEQPCAYATALNNERHLALADALGTLPSRERSVLEARFGLAGEEPLTLHQAAARLGVSHETVRRIEGRALRLVRLGLKCA